MQSRTINPMPRPEFAQMQLAMPGCPSALEEAWAVHKPQLAPLTLSQALGDPLLGRLLRAHAARIDAMRRRAAHRRSRRLAR